MKPERLSTVQKLKEKDSMYKTSKLEEKIKEKESEVKTLMNVIKKIGDR